MNYKRISVVGCCGAGKSTLAIQISKKMLLPVHHLDQLFWLPNWQQRPIHDFKQLHDEIIKKDTWILDGNNSSTMMQRFENSDLLIVLNYSRTLTYWRLIKRIITHFGKTRNDMPKGCKERLNLHFFRYVLGFHKTTYRKIFSALEEVEKKPKLIILKSPKETDAFLNSSC